MKTIELNGIIETDHTSNWNKIKLVQDDGYKIDLVGRFVEISESFQSNEVQVSYYISNDNKTKRELIEQHLKYIFGTIDASYEANGYAYSSWTTGTDYDCNLKIGGHDLFKELMGHKGKYILIILNFKT